MEGVQDIQESETASVVKVSREPAIIINGVPDLPSDCTSGLQLAVRDAPGSQVDPRFGEWLEGRKVKKRFGDKYYVGNVVKYDSESNWYNVVYEDGDREDLEWQELEEVLLPLDISIPLKTLVMDKCKLQSRVSGYRPKASKPKKVYAIREAKRNKKSDVIPVSQGITVMSNQTMVGVANSQQSNNVPGLVLASASNDAQACPNTSSQPRKRGRPRKEPTIADDNKSRATTAKAERLKREQLRGQSR
ncbi:dirigent protein 17 [Brachypodium distachyon]|uniref:PTM/DIR17-like Tudor domain-containing protein n=1 Tax=Brachypodium distachyon TaxID=15368 RepID=I1HT52_BRADI|nr:dirigent protein 17 [Brachypodium distachyon]KQK10464.1 hypothetical protein BRADI_2g54250v3 [Brachypodium distachyon]|eukprot:XP_003564555.1 dirigent protein 17 [Brachypodium distachyon]